MSSTTRFTLDPDRLFPDHAYAPGYEPTLPEPEPEEPPGMVAAGDIVGFVAAAGLVMGAMALISVVLLWF